LKKKTVATWIYFQVCSMFTWLGVCSTQPLCRGIQSAFRRVTHQRPRRRRRRRVYFGAFHNNPENSGVDQIVTRPTRLLRGVATAGATGPLAPAMLKPRGGGRLRVSFRPSPNIFPHFACCSLNFQSCMLSNFFTNKMHIVTENLTNKKHTGLSYP